MNTWLRSWSAVYGWRTSFEKLNRITAVFRAPVAAAATLGVALAETSYRRRA